MQNKLKHRHIFATIFKYINMMGTYVWYDLLWFDLFIYIWFSFSFALLQIYNKQNIATIIVHNHDKRIYLE